MLETLEYGLYVTTVGMGGVFVVLSIIAFFMWSMGRFSLGAKNVEVKEKSNGMDDKELFAVVTAVYVYKAEHEREHENNVLPVLGSKGWKNASKMEVLG